MVYVNLKPLHKIIYANQIKLCKFCLTLGDNAEDNAMRKYRSSLYKYKSVATFCFDIQSSGFQDPKPTINTKE